VRSFSIIIDFIVRELRSYHILTIESKIKWVENIKKEHGYDLNKLQYIGKGMHGTVYKIDDCRCIKIFKKKETCEKEIETLAMAQGNGYFPKLYDFGERYIVREFIEGIELDKYLKSNPLTLELSKKLVYIYEALGEVGYRRQDTALLHIFINPREELRVIDTAKAMSKTAKYPSIILGDLKGLGLITLFLDHVKEVRPDLYKFFTRRK
jgi:predicted Ser/Thr protein kinase